MMKKILSIVLVMAICITLFPNSANAATIKLDRKTAVVTEGDYLQLTLKGTKKKPTWYSSNEYLASVSENGKVTTKGTGKVNITAKLGTKKYVCNVTIIPNIDPNYKTDKDIEIALAERDYIDNFGKGLPKDAVSKEKSKGLPSKKTVLIGQTYTLKLNGIEGTAKWSSSNKSVVAVNTKGKIRGVKKGTATVSATVGDKTYACKVTVNPKTLFTDKSKITTSVGKKIKVVITLKTDLEDTVYAKITNDTNDNDRDDLLYFDEKEIATFEFGDWNGDRIPLYVTAKASGKINLIIYSEITKEKIIIPIVIK